MLAAVDAWAQRVGRARACRAFGYSERTDRSRRQAAAGRLHRRPSQAKPREQHQPQPSRIPDQLRDHIAELLCSPRFRDQAPAQVYYQLLDEGSYVCSIRQMYRILEERGLVRERRRGHRHTTHHAPQVQASGPNEVWSWDISRLRGPHHRSWFYLYVVIDIFSRKIVAWTVDTAESTEVARTLVGTACDRNGISPQQLTLHSDRGAQMTSTSLAELLEDLAVTRSLSRPRVSNDNPYSEAGFTPVSATSTPPRSTAGKPWRPCRRVRRPWMPPTASGPSGSATDRRGPPDPRRRRGSTNPSLQQPPDLDRHGEVDSFRCGSVRECRSRHAGPLQ